MLATNLKENKRVELDQGSKKKPEAIKSNTLH